MTERPILFSDPLVRRILADEKTQTRRIVGLSCFKPSETPGYAWTFRGRAPVRSVAQQLRHPRGCWQDLHHDALLKLCPYGKPGDRLWVRETWARLTGNGVRVVYRADAEDPRTGWEDRPLNHHPPMRWAPSIHMPRALSRLTLEVTGVRLQEISEEDARAEGVEPHPMHHFCKPERRLTQAFATLWDSINGERAPWSSNPWVWAISFRRLP